MLRIIRYLQSSVESERLRVAHEPPAAPMTLNNLHERLTELEKEIKQQTASYKQLRAQCVELEEHKQVGVPLISPSFSLSHSLSRSLSHSLSALSHSLSLSRTLSQSHSLSLLSPPPGAAQRVQVVWAGVPLRRVLHGPD